MPFALGGLAVVALGLFAFITVVGIVWALNGIANVLERANPFSGIVAIGAWIASIASSIEGTLVEAGGSLWNGVAEWVQGHAYLMQQMAAEILSLAVNTRETTSLLHNHTIPEAQLRGEVNAYNFASLLDDHLRGEAAAATGTAETLYLPEDWAPYGRPPGGGPNFGNDILAAIAAGVGTAAIFATQAAETAKEDAHNRVTAAETKAERQLQETAAQLGHAVAEAAATQGAHLTAVESHLLEGIASAERTAQDRLTAAREALERGTHEAEGHATTQLHATTESLEETIRSNAVTVVGDLERDRVKLEGEVAAAAGTAKTDLEHEREGLEAKLTAAKDDLTAQLEGHVLALEAATTAAGAAAHAELEHAKGELEAAATAVHAGIVVEGETFVRGVIEDITDAAVAAGGDLSTLGPLLAAAIAVPAAALAARVATLEECAVTKCEGPNNLEKLLEALLGVVSLAELAAFLEPIVHEPATAVREDAGELSVYTQKAESFFESLLSL